METERELKATQILLVPTTEVLFTSRDRETSTLYADLAASEDFLASHVLRVPVANGPNNVRDSRGKAKQYTTFNGRTVVVKESFVYSNKGFKNLNQAQLLTDVLYYPNNLDAQQWLIYYISRPLVGSLEPIKITPATLPDILERTKGSGNDGDATAGTTPAPEKKDIQSFNDLLNSFPMIARQMQAGLDRVFKEFQKEVKSRAESSKSPRLSRRHSGASSHSGSNGSIHSRYSNGHVKPPSIATLHVEEEEDHLRRSLEAAVTAATDLFQLVDKQQLSYLGSSTDLTGPMVERLIERYITEQLHDASLFPLLRDSRKLEDLELESRIHQMQYVDVSQVGITIEDGRHGKEQLMKRLRLGVEEFRKLGVAGSPQEMMDILLRTQKVITGVDVPSTATNSTARNDARVLEKPEMNITMNADTLVSLLLIVVIRSQVRHLQARLTYMKGFIFIDDVESGEMGYALSTFEAVLSYLASDSGGLRKASRRNKRLWRATKSGNLQDLKAIITPSRAPSKRQSPTEDTENPLDSTLEHEDDHPYVDGNVDSKRGTPPERRFSEASTQKDSYSEASTLAHVFPFQNNDQNESAALPIRKNKRVSMDMRSLSVSSEYSALSRSNTVDSRASAIEGDTSIATLTQTQDSNGDSLLMMAVEARQPEILGYLLSLEDYFPLNVVLEDSNSEGTTLLSAAVQLAHSELIEEILQCVLQTRDKQTLLGYLCRQDNRGRTVAHYLFNAPYLISRLGEILPWRQKDKNGQTPLLALCRSYDHPNYLDMVNEALHFATIQQGDDQPLHLDYHVDGKGNTILHVINSPSIAMRVLRHCDSNANASNDKKFTPLMVASKYGRTDMVRAFFGDQRVDVAARELRGMTAVELAKDDDVRNRIDDMVLISNVPAADGRVTSVVRSFFVEDASIRLIIKSAVRNDNGMVCVTTCRRSLEDFENLAKWLSLEHPASWLPSIFNFRSPFQIPSRPSRAALQDIQVRLDRFLKIMLSHSTFSTHELLWEFILFPEIQPEMMAERSRKKAEIRAENIRDEYEPIDDVKDVESFVGFARETLRPVNHSTKSVLRRVTNIQNSSTDFATSLDLTVDALKTFTFLPPAHMDAFTRYAACSHVPESHPLKLFHQDLTALLSTILAILSSLSRPHSLITSMTTIQKSIDRHASSLRRSDRWPLGLLDETRKGIQEKAQKSREELRSAGCELRYTQQTVAAELAEWQELHARLGRRAVRGLAQRMVVRQRDQLENMKRAVRGVVDVDR
ncbi:MAG: hypothetical protein Q9195_009395 [Heterodermia aff. obscurata]